jgi:hypothetical protein
LVQQRTDATGFVGMIDGGPEIHGLKTDRARTTLRRQEGFTVFRRRPVTPGPSGH